MGFHHGLFDSLVAFLGCVLLGHAQNVEMDWATDTYGPDGPWNALSVTAGANSVSLYPRSPACSRSYLISSDFCSTNADTASCGVGGTVSNLASSDALTCSLNIQEGTYDFSLNGNVSETLYNLGSQSWQASVFSVDASTLVTYPSGRQLAPELGLFDAGLPFNVPDTSCTNLSCDPMSYLYSQGKIASTSWGLHMGAAQLDYPGSLVLGGYDKGRAIGPAVSVTAHNSDDFQYGSPYFPLIDVTVGVETGGSPISNDTLYLYRSGGFADSTTAYAPVAIDSGVPYIFLNQPTIDALASVLPIYHDIASNYYLWKTSDSRYTKTITSASYLGFVFSGSNNANVTIKVPFMLLNLTLETAASGLGSNVQYFPVQPIGSSSSSLYFGRAFLQATFWAEIFDNTTRIAEIILAQAPGPGANKQGLGHNVQNISKLITALDFDTGDNLFNQSWAGVWTPIPLTDSQQKHNPQQGNQNHKSGGGGLSGGAIAGIAIGGFVILACAAFLIFLVLKRRRQSRARAPQEPRHELGGYRVGSVHRKEMPGSDPARELPPQNRFEMYGGSPAAAHELPHWGQYPKPDEQQRWSQLPASPSER